MTREEAKQVFLSRGYVEVEGGTIYSPDKWREACRVISDWLEQEPILDKIRAEIEHMIPCSKETLSMKLGILEIIDKYKVESGEV